MIKLMFGGMGTVVVLALVSAIFMVASAPASTITAADNPALMAKSVTTGKTDNAIGRLVLTFEPASPTIDRN